MSIIIDSYKFSSGSLWTPAQISTRLWLDASDAGSITHTGGLVDQWNDKSGSGFNATATGTGRPTTGSQTMNSLNTLLFDGLSDFMTFASAPMAGTTSGLAVIAFQVAADPASNSTRNSSPLAGWGTDFNMDHVPFTDGNIYIGFLSSTRFSAGNPSQSLASSPCVMSHVSAASLFELYINGNSQFSTTSSTYAVGSSPMIAKSGTTNFLDGKIGEIVVVPNNTSTTNRQLLEGYMAHKWGAVANLPGGHPYKSAPPTI